jgi:regulator of sigma D
LLKPEFIELKNKEKALEKKLKQIQKDIEKRKRLEDTLVMCL